MPSLMVQVIGIKNINQFKVTLKFVLTENDDHKKEEVDDFDLLTCHKTRKQTLEANILKWLVIEKKKEIKNMKNQFKKLTKKRLSTIYFPKKNIKR